VTEQTFPRIALDQITTSKNVHLVASMARPFMYKCPNTGMYVQGWTESEDENLLSYESVACPLCQRPHLVNVKTGRVAGTIKEKSGHTVGAD